jgi:hypothetical protein
MNKAIIYNNGTGVSVVYPAPNARRRILVSEAVTKQVEEQVTTYVQETDEETGVAVHVPRTQTVSRTVEVTPAVYRDQTDEEFLVMVATQSVPAGVSHQVVDISAIPQDRTFRNAWKADGARVVEDVEKAKEVAKDILRAKRAPVMDDLDVQFMQALERGDDPALIVAEKQRLRDITKIVDGVSSLSELKEIAASAVQAPR